MYSCTYCGRKDHLVKFYYERINASNDHIWARKTNILGSKKIWVPKSTPLLIDIGMHKDSRRREWWYLTSSFSKHMTWYINNFATVSRYHEGGTSPLELTPRAKSLV